ncbi:MAG: Type 1 glutamine amidotransferase-like domain-containing protein [bacterium]
MVAGRKAVPSLRVGRQAVVFIALSTLAVTSSCASATVQGATNSAPRVGPSAGTVVVVGGGSVGPEILTRFIELAGGPEALIIDVPTAGGDSVYPANWRGMNALKAAGARNVHVLHTLDRKVAESDQFAEPLAKAGGVWFEGGRQWHLVDSYAGTKTERGFHDVLARGGVVGGSSAGASILSSYMLRGARSGNEIIMAPGYEEGFGFLRGVAIDQHVVARERLRDLADSLMPRRPDLLGISEDEGTAWFVRGDIADIVGRNKAFVYGGKDATDARKPFLTLYPGDRYDLAARRVVHRAWDDSPVSRAFVDSLFAGVSGKATVLVAQGGKVFIDQAYGIPDHPKYLPATTVPNFALGGVATPIEALVKQLAVANDKLGLPQRVTRYIGTPVGWHKTTADSSGTMSSNVDELYRFALGTESARTFRSDTASVNPPLDYTLGWNADQVRGLTRLSAYGTSDGKRNAFVRIPDRRATIIILTDGAQVDAKGIADRIAERLLR